MTTVKDVCADCGFVYAEIGPAEAPDKLRGFARRYRAPLTRFLPARTATPSSAGGRSRAPGRRWSTPPTCGACSRRSTAG